MLYTLSAFLLGSLKWASGQSCSAGEGQFYCDYAYNFVQDFKEDWEAGLVDERDIEERGVNADGFYLFLYEYSSGHCQFSGGYPDICSTGATLQEIGADAGVDLGDYDLNEAFGRSANAGGFVLYPWVANPGQENEATILKTSRLVNVDCDGDYCGSNYYLGAGYALNDCEVCYGPTDRSSCDGPNDSDSATYGSHDSDSASYGSHDSDSDSYGSHDSDSDSYGKKKGYGRSHGYDSDSHGSHGSDSDSYGKKKKGYGQKKKNKNKKKRRKGRGYGRRLLEKLGDF